MPKISSTPNPLHACGDGGSFCGYYTYPSNLGSITAPSVATVHFTPTEWKRMTKKERDHARNVATLMGGFKRLIWYVKEMQKSKCRYRDAVVKVNKRR